MFQFLKTTVLGGIVFLVPVIILIAVVGKALVFTRQLALPLENLLPFGPIANTLVINLLALALVVLTCFLGGVAAKSAIAVRLVGSLESNILSKIPIYALIKDTISTSLQSEEAEGMKPVLARFDECWQVALEVERMAGGKVAVYLPGTPNPWSGSVCFLTEDRITSLDMKLLPALGILKSFGKGSGSQLQAYFEQN